MNSIVCNDPAHHTPNPGRQIVVFPTIQEAIDHAEEWDSIFVEPGTYHENIVVNKAVEIYSNCMDDCIIIGDGMSPTMSITHDDVKLSELTFSGGGAGQSGILVSGVRDIKLNRVTCSGSKNGLELVGSGDNWIVSCVFSGNTEYGFKASAGSDDNNVADCFATGNGNGFGFFDSARNRPSNNAAYANTNIGFNMVNCSLSAFVTNMSQYNVVGVSFDGSDGNTFMTGSIGYCGTGIRLINSDNNLIYSTPVTYPSTVVDLSLDAASNTNTIAHNFYTTHTDLGTGTRFQNNHVNTPSDDTDVAIVSYVKALPYLATQTTHDVWVDKYRSDTYTPTGSITKPFTKIQDAVDYIASVAVAGQDWSVMIGTGQYVENLTLENTNLHMISLVGIGGVVGINPATGNAIQSTTNNANLLKFRMCNIEVTRPVVITGPNGGVNFADVWIQDCKFVLNATLTLSCISNFSLMSTYIETDIILTNVVWFYVDSGRLNGILTMVCDSTANKPSGFTSGTTFVNGVYEMGNVTLTKGGTAAGVFVAIGSRINGSSGTITVPAGWTLQAYNSFIRGNLTNNGTFQQRGSFVEGTLTNAGTWTNNQAASQIKNVPAGAISATDVQSAINELDTEKPTISTGTAAPATTPTKVGNIFVDTNNKKLYFAVGTGSSADWIAS